LDRETSGVTIVAMNPVTAGELGRLWETRAVEKEYLAVVHGHVREDHGIIDAPLGKDERSRVVVKDCVRPDGSPSRTEFWVQQRFARDVPTTNGALFTLLRLKPHTGRKHQIRIHLAHAGYPVVGDKLYGGDEDLYLALAENRLTETDWQRLILRNQALHAAELRLVWRKQDVRFAAQPEAEFREFCVMESAA
jgi:23S rRNA pseudouridine1911/1915/1917 synthase